MGHQQPTSPNSVRSRCYWPNINSIVDSTVCGYRSPSRFCCPRPVSSSSFENFDVNLFSFAPRHRPGASFVNALLATALFRCWHILLFFAGWSSLITVLNKRGHDLSMSTALLTVWACFLLSSYGWQVIIAMHPVLVPFSVLLSLIERPRLSNGTTKDGGYGHKL